MEVAPGIFEKYFPTDVNAKVPYMFELVCLIWSCQLLFAFLTVTAYKSEDGEAYDPHGHSTAFLAGEVESREHWAERSIKLKDIIFSKEFAYLYILFVCFIFFGYYIISVFKTFGSQTINNDTLLTYVGAFGSLMNGVFRIFWSTMLDYYSFKQVFGALIILQFICIVLVQIVVVNKWAYLIVVCISMQCEGAIASILPTTTLSVFGMKRGHLVYSLMFSAFGVSALIGGILVKTLQD